MDIHIENNSDLIIKALNHNVRILNVIAVLEIRFQKKNLHFTQSKCIGEKGFAIKSHFSSSFHSTGFLDFDNRLIEENLGFNHLFF